MTGILNALLGFLRPSAAGPYVIIQTFTSSTTWVCPGGVTEVEYLVVGGGGGGGACIGAGGGAGGLRTGTGFCCNHRHFLHDYCRCWRCWVVQLRQGVLVLILFLTRLLLLVAVAVGQVQYS
jgi:hypothetical protein